MNRQTPKAFDRFHEYWSQLRLLSVSLADKEGTVKCIAGMINVIRDTPMPSYQAIKHATTAAHDFSFIDVGVGVPAKQKIQKPRRKPDSGPVQRTL